MRRSSRLTPHPQVGTIPLVRVAWSCLVLVYSSVSATACGTVDLGDNFVAPDHEVDENFFFCRIQPEVLSRYSCASGAAGESGSCHSARSALRLSEVTETLPCDGNRPTGAVPASYRSNLDRLRFTLQDDALSSPLYRRPVGLDVHPRVIFSEADDAAKLIVEWISGQAR